MADSDTFTVRVGEDVHTLKVHPINLVFKSPELHEELKYEKSVVITPEMTLRYSAHMVAPDPRTESLFRTVFSDWTKEFTVAGVLASGAGPRHVLGLIEITLLASDRGARVVWRHPESHLHPKHQCNLADVVIELTRLYPEPKGLSDGDRDSVAGPDRVG